MKGKTVLVTGGSRGIGKEIVAIFLEEGATVHFISTGPSPYMEELTALAERNATSVVWHQGNVADEEEIQRIGDMIVHQIQNAPVDGQIAQLRPGDRLSMICDLNGNLSIFSRTVDGISAISGVSVQEDK